MKEDNTCNKNTCKIGSHKIMQASVMKIYIWPC